MNPSGEFPAVLRSNAFTGERVAEGALHPQVERSLRAAPPVRQRFLADFEPSLDLHNWEDERVGWGIVALAPPGVGDDVLKDNGDLPESVRELIKKRENAPVFRFRPGPRGHQYLTNYRSNADFEIAQSGIGTERLPQYLLILGGPENVPWTIQFLLNSRRFVGRLPLSGADLDNYIRHLLDDWKESEAQTNQTLVWATDYGYPDITELMRSVIAKPVQDKYANNPKIGENAALRERESATRENLAEALKSKPGLIVSTSHGLIGPLSAPDQIFKQIGALVDQSRHVLDPVKLLEFWQPDGAIWYAHACCSAGTDGARQFQDLASGDSELGLTLAALKKAGPAIAPLPVHLLAAKKPARAFIGHVEPTFDCTLRNSQTGELFTGPIIEALYTQLLQGSSAGIAIQYLLAPLASVHSSYLNMRQNFDGSSAMYAQMFNYSLRGSDLEGTVLMGDPTVKLRRMA